MMDGVEADEADHDEVDGDHVVQQARHDEDQDARNERDDRRYVGDGEMHRDLPGWNLSTDEAGGRFRSRRAAAASILGFALVMRIEWRAMQVPLRANGAQGDCSMSTKWIVLAAVAVAGLAAGSAAAQTYPVRP